MTETDWNKRAVCSCGWHQYAPFGDSFHIHLTCCPKCGASKSKWAIKTMRHIADESKIVWWKPWTWNEYLWEVKG